MRLCAAGTTKEPRSFTSVNFCITLGIVLDPWKAAPKTFFRYSLFNVQNLHITIKVLQLRGLRREKSAYTEENKIFH